MTRPSTEEIRQEVLNALGEEKIVDLEDATGGPELINDGKKILPLFGVKGDDDRVGILGGFRAPLPARPSPRAGAGRCAESSPAIRSS